VKKNKVIGLMSGSSLDGVDIAYCEFYYDTKWHYSIIKADTIPYIEEWRIVLTELPEQKGDKLIEYDISYGNYLGNIVNDFIESQQLNPDLISSHGHTIFHKPDKGYTFQLGNGQAIASSTGINTICDFRIGDIQHGGQGAPLVPIGDELLFPEYDFCINLGGIANISYVSEGKRIAFDICAANQLLNHLSHQIGKPFDENGNIAQLGKLNTDLFEKLNNHPYFNLDYPKSISNQLITDTFINLLDDSDASVEDSLYTVCKHIAYQINQAINDVEGDTKLITGGGAHNDFLITAIQKEIQRKLTIPDKMIVDYKEAMIFAFMGVLRFEGQINCLASSTGASRDSSVGVIYIPS
jgi:anhydro-N-acetylmuramic acid kinase